MDVLTSRTTVEAAVREAYGGVEGLLEFGGGREAGGGSYESCVVLCKITNDYDPFAVWMLVAPGVGEGRRPFLVSGSYCSTLERALEVFNDRAGKRAA